MKINKDIIKALKPCDDRFNNYVNNYQDAEFDLKGFLELDKITYNDKVWVVTKLFTQIQNVKWSVLCASSTLKNFEKLYPEDKRPRLAIEAAALYYHQPTEENKSAARLAADSAADSAAYSAAYSAARSAAYSAYSAADSAAYSAAYSAARSAAYSAAYSAYSAADSAAYSAARLAAEKAQEELNLIFILEAE